MKYPKWIDEAHEFHTRTRGFMALYCSPSEMEKWDEQIAKFQQMKQVAGGLFWITVNVKPDVTFEQLEKAVSKMLSKTWVTKYAYAYEFRGLSGGNNGLHVHIALPRGSKRPSEGMREIRNTFKSLVGEPAKHIDIREYDISLWDDKIKYLNGVKDDDEKEESIAFTVAERLRLGIKEIYKSNI